MLGGRGAGKTRAGAEWVRELVLVASAATRAARSSGIALVGETLADVRDVMVNGESGLLQPRLGERSDTRAGSDRSGGSNCRTARSRFAFSSEDPESLRGPQFSAAWCDELAKWKYPDATWDMLQFGLRLGTRPRQVVTTTPRPMPLLKRHHGRSGDGDDARRGRWTMRRIWRRRS